MASRLVVPLVLVAMAASACSGGEGAADTTPPTPSTLAPTTPSTTTPTTTATTTSTTAAPTTATPPTTAPPTTAPPTTPAPTAPEVTASTRPLPVPDGFTLEEVQVIDRDFREGFRRYYEVLADPFNDALVQAALDYTIGAETAGYSEIVDLFRSENRRIEQLPSPPLSFEILQGPTRRANSEEVALVVCHVAPFITYRTEADGTRTTLNDGVVTQELSLQLRLESGLWKRAGQSIEGQWRGVVRCQDMA